MQNYKRHFSVFACLVFIFIAGCSTGRAPLTGSLSGEREVITDYPEGCSKYEWIHSIPEATDNYLYRFGLSDNHATEASARNQAMINCINEFARYCGVEIKQVYDYLAFSYGKSSEVTDPTVAIRDSQKHFVEAFVSRVKAQKWCIQKIKKTSGNTALEYSWKAYVLATVPVDEVQKVKDYKPPEPPPPLSLHVTNMGNNRYCIEVKSHLGMPITNFRMMEQGHQIFPNNYCMARGYNYQINEGVAVLDFSSTGSILLGGTNDSFNFYLPESGVLTVNYSIDNKHYNFSHQYDLSD